MTKGDRRGERRRSSPRRGASGVPHQKRRPSRTSKPERPPSERIYQLFWKPYGVLSQFSPASNSDAPTLKRFISTPELYPAGRLDRDSEGLLLLTNDGVFQHKLCDPRFGHWRTYWVQVEGAITEEAIAQLSAGVLVRGQMSKPARAARLTETPDLPPREPPIRVRQQIPTSWLSLSLTEGMNRQVRRMTAAVGYPTLRLIRAEIELNEEVSLTLRGLSPGSARRLTPHELTGARALRARLPEATSSPRPRSR